MPGLVKCTVCGRRVSSDAVAEIKGKPCCPPCHKKLSARLKAKKSGAAPAPANRAPVPARPGAKAAKTSSDKIMNKVNAYRGRGLGGGPALPDMPDLPAQFMNQPSRGSSGFVLESPGGPAFCGLMACGLYAAYAFTGLSEAEKPGAAALLVLGLAALSALPAALLGLLEVIQGSSNFRRVCSAAGMLMGAFVAFKAGSSFYDGVAKLPSPDKLVTAGAPEEKTRETGQPDVSARNQGSAGPTEKKPAPRETAKPAATRPAPKPSPKPKPKPKMKSAFQRDQEQRTALVKELLEKSKPAAATNPKLEDLALISRRALAGLELRRKDSRLEGTFKLKLGPNKLKLLDFVAKIEGEEVKITGFIVSSRNCRVDLTTDGKWIFSETGAAK